MIPVAKPILGKEEIREVGKILRSGKLVQGEYVEKFEKEFAKFCGVDFAIATSSGSTALYTSLLASEIGSGDEVITTPFSFIATANSIISARAKPVFVDIDPRTFNINPKLIEKAITKRTKALLVVHLFGLPADMNQILKIAKRFKLQVIEDSAQAIGADINGKKVGSFGVGCFSFYATKNLTTGEGGMITTSNKSVADKARLIRNHGMTKRYFNDYFGFNFRMTEIQAAIGIVQLKKLAQFNTSRALISKYFNKHLKNVAAPFTPANFKHAFNQYTIRVAKKSRDEILKKLRKNGIWAEIYYPVPIHKQRIYKDLVKEGFPETEKASEEVISLPIHPSLKKSDLNKIVTTLNKLLY